MEKNIYTKKEVKLSNYIIDIAAGPFGSNLKVDCFVSKGFPIIDGANLKGIKVTDNITKFVTEEKARSLHRSIAKKNDVIVTISGNVGQISYIPSDSKYDEYLVSQRQFRATFDTTKVYVPYLIYYFHTKEGQHKILSFANQTGVPALAQPLKNFKNIDIQLPKIEIQKSIASILEKLDSKIELNRRINENLEQQVQALFKSWFVDFVPFKDGKFVDSELGKIPEGWKVGTIGDYCKIRSGFAFKSSWWTDKGVKVVKIKNISSSGNLDMNDCSYVNKENTLKAKEFSLKPGDLLIAMTGATIGKFCLVPILKERMYVNQRVGKFFLGENPILKVPFIYGLLKRENIISQIINKGQGSAQPNISANDIESIPIILPTKEIISKYNEMVSPYFSLLIKELNECDYLANLRDTLLPKLMSGELKLSE